MRTAVGEIGSPLEAAFEELPCMALIERGGSIVARNALARRMTGTIAGASERMGMHEVLAEAYGLREEDERCRFDCLLVRKYGKPIPVHAVSQRVIFEGETCRLVLLMEQGESARSVADGMQVEDMLDALPEATAITHADGIVHVNVAFTRLFGYSEVECVGRELGELVVPDGRQHERELMEHTVRQDGRAEMETVRRTRSGEELDVCVSMVQVPLGGETVGSLMTYRDIRVQKQERERLRHSALHDGLTGLANRAKLLERVKLTLGRLRRRPDWRFAVIFLDLDGFKRVNDTMGHAAGDQLLVQVAERLTRCLRPQDAVARFGGDEFAMLLDESGGAYKVEAVAERIQEEIRRPFELEGFGTARVSASIGVVMASPEHASAEEILEAADAAMYGAKAAGKARYVMVDGREPTAMLGFLDDDSKKDRGEEKFDEARRAGGDERKVGRR